METQWCSDSETRPKYYLSVRHRDRPLLSSNVMFPGRIKGGPPLEYWGVFCYTQVRYCSHSFTVRYFVTARLLSNRSHMNYAVLCKTDFDTYLNVL